MGTDTSMRGTDGGKRERRPADGGGLESHPYQVETPGLIAAAALGTSQHTATAGKESNRHMAIRKNL